jgi:hypothetical protein
MIILAIGLTSFSICVFLKLGIRGQAGSLKATLQKRGNPMRINSVLGLLGGMLVVKPYVSEIYPPVKKKIPYFVLFWCTLEFHKS